MKYIGINQLAYKKCNKTSYNNPHTLSEYSIESILHIGYMIFFNAAANPEICGRHMYCRIKHEKCVRDKCNCSKRNPSYCFRSVIFIYDVGHYKFKRLQ